MWTRLLKHQLEPKYRHRPKKSSSNGDEDMAYQSEAALEAQFVEQLNNQSYSSVSVPDQFDFHLNFFYSYAHELNKGVDLLLF